MAHDFKKSEKALYSPAKKPHIISIPPMQFIAVRGQGDPNEEGGSYVGAVEMLYGIAYTLKMSYKGDHKIEGFYEYVVPPLEGLWWQKGVMGFDPTRKDQLHWISMIRVPEFVKEKDFAWAVETATKKKKKDFSKAEFFRYDEGLCVQCMHIGPYDEELPTVEAMDTYAEQNGYTLDFSRERMHHEIYLGDPRKTAPVKLKTILRHPVRKV